MELGISDLSARMRDDGVQKSLQVAKNSAKMQSRIVGRRLSLKVAGRFTLTEVPRRVAKQ